MYKYQKLFEIYPIFKKIFSGFVDVTLRDVTWRAMSLLMLSYQTFD